VVIKRIDEAEVDEMGAYVGNKTAAVLAHVIGWGKDVVF
jgi:hypothetical protein